MTRPTLQFDICNVFILPQHGIKVRMLNDLRQLKHVGSEKLIAINSATTFRTKLNDHVVAISLLFIRSHVQRRTSGTFEEKLEQRSEDSVVFGGARGKREIGGTMR